MRLIFHGAVGEVTGSCFELDTGQVRFLIDCGMFQGGSAAEAKNRRFAFDPREIAFVLLSHAHIDHSGLIPIADCPVAVRAVAGVNAAVVGLLGAALYDPVWTSAVRGPLDVAIAVIGFTLLAAWRASALIVVLWCVAAAVAVTLV
jgi:glyoxylase-like metal-dependent hydrolase (beta-lactamase superfamily II)